MKKLICALEILALCLFACACGSEELLKKTDDFYYNDAANVLSYETKGVIYYNSKALYEACGSQIVIVTVTDTDGYTTRDYSTKLINEWGVGDKNKDNGFLLLMLIGKTDADSDYYLGTGSGTAGIIGNSEVGDLLDIYFEDDFAAGNYDEGVVKLYQALYNIITGYYHVETAFQSAQTLINNGIIASNSYYDYDGNAFNGYGGAQGGGGGNESRGGSMFIIVLIVLLIVVIIVLSGSSRPRGYGFFPIFMSRRRGYRTPPPPRPYEPRAPRTGSYRAAPPRSGSFGSYRPSSSRPSGTRSGFSSGRSGGFGGGRSGGFGGARGGGGRSSGGGAGRR